MRWASRCRRRRRPARGRAASRARGPAYPCRTGRAKGAATIGGTTRTHGSPTVPRSSGSSRASSAGGAFRASSAAGVRARAARTATAAGEGRDRNRQVCLDIGIRGFNAGGADSGCQRPRVVGHGVRAGVVGADGRAIHQDVVTDRIAAGLLIQVQAMIAVVSPL